MTTQNEDLASPASSVKERVSVTPLFRKAILSATQNRLVAKGVRRYGMRFGAARFVAGETLDEAVAVLRGLNAQGLKCNTTILGEGVHDEATASQVVAGYKEVLDRIASEKLDVNVALKLSHLGLDLGEETAYRNVQSLVVHAASLGNFVRIDMEESARVDATIRIYKRLRADGHDNTGAVLQSYLFRTEADLADLLPLNPNLRYVKGAYLESPEIAHTKKSDVDGNYVKLVERALLAGCFSAVATHDEKIIEHVISFAVKNGVPKEQFQIQMLYGIRTQLQLDLAKRGFSVLVATPFGPDWYFYLMRRLAERPANAMFFAKSLIKR